MANSRRGAWLGMTALCAVAFAQTAGGAIYKCQDAQGKVTYQQKPCEGSAAAPTAPQAPGSTSPAARVDTKGAPPPATAQKTEPAVVTFLVQKYQCDLGRPEIARQTKANYERWRERNAQEITRVESSADYRSLLEDARKKPAPGVTPAQMDKNCRDVVQFLDQEGRR